MLIQYNIDLQHYVTVVVPIRNCQLFINVLNFILKIQSDEKIVIL